MGREVGIDDTVREFAVQLAAEHDPEIDGPHQQLERQFGIRVGAQVAPVDGAADDARDFRATCADDAVPEWIPRASG